IGGTWPYSLHHPLSAQEAAYGVGAQRGTVASSTAGCGAAGPGPSAWAAEYIFYLSETSIFLGSNPSCHHVDIGSFLTVLSLLTAVLVGPGPWSQLWAWVGNGPCCSSPSHQPVPVVRKPGLLSSFLLGDTGLGWE
uniref:Uncharacterized protein n=1 Tax=Cebus imitator TaxID=2715852 RepID=A0A2K5SIT3_CEBIM